MPVPAPLPAPWVRMPPGGTHYGGHPTIDPAPDVDLTAEIWWLHQLWCARQEWKWCIGQLRWPQGNRAEWNPPGNIITAATETTITCSPGTTNWIGDGNNPWINVTSADDDDPWVPDGPAAYDVVVEVGPAGTADPEDPDFLAAAICDQARVVRSHVESRDSATSITVANMRDYVTSGQISSFSELVGREVHFVKSNGLWPVLRWPTWANAEEVERSTVAAFTANSLRFVLPDRIVWRVDKYKPYIEHEGEENEEPVAWELIVRDSAGLMRRIPIKVPEVGEEEPPISETASDADGTVWFDTIDDEDWTPSGDCVIVRVSERYRLRVNPASDPLQHKGHEKHQVDRFYSGARDLFWAHSWQEEGGNGWLRQFMQPAASIPWLSEDPLIPGLCVLTQHVEPLQGTSVDWDAWSAPDEICSEADKSYSPHIYKTLRMIQVDQDNDAGTAIEPGLNYTAGRDGIPWMTIPILYRKAGVNAHTSTLSSYNATTGLATVASIDLPYTPITVYYTLHIYDSNGDIASPSYTAEKNVTAPGSFSVTVGAGLEPDDVNGKQVDITLGRTRFAPLHFQEMFPRTCRIPDIDPDPLGGGGALENRAVVDWEEYGNAGVGEWIRRAPSTTYTPESGGNAFENGQLARWVSPGWNDAVNGPAAGDNTVGPLLPFFDHFYSGIHPQPLQLDTVTSLLSGQMTRPPTRTNNRQLKAEDSTSRYRFSDTRKNWYRDIWHQGNGSGIGTSVTGTATGGGTTSLEDSSIVVGTESGAKWHAEQFIGFASPYVGFIVEVKIDTEVESIDPTTGKPELDEEGEIVLVTVPIWHARPIKTSSTAGSKITLTWDEALPEIAAGKEWRIREPQYELNRFEGRRVRLYIPDEEPVEVEILANDDHTIYLKTPTEDPIPFDAWYEILEYVPGGVWKRASGPPEDGRPYVRQGSGQYWVAPRGADVARTAIPDVGPFHINQSENEPDYVKRYGRIQKNDIIRARHIYDEIVRIENCFRWIKGSYELHTAQTGDVAANNQVDIGQEIAGTRPLPESGPPCNYAATTDDEAHITYNELKANAAQYWIDSGGGTPGASVAGFPGSSRTLELTSEGVWAWSAGYRFIYVAAVDPPLTSTKVGIMHSTAIAAHTVSPNQQDEYTPVGANPAGGVGVNFDAQGSGAVEGKWAILAESGPVLTFDGRIKVGDDIEPPNWPREIADGEIEWVTLIEDPPLCVIYPFSGYRGWEVDNIIVIHKFDVEGGRKMLLT